MDSAAAIRQEQDSGIAIDDGRLLARVRQGDKSAFALLVRRHSERFYRVAYRFVGSRDAAEDMVQEAFLKLWEKPFLWQEDKNAAFTTWFYRVVVNLCLDHKKKKRPLLLVDDTLVPDDRQTQEEVLMSRQKQLRLEAQIAALPQRQRVALNLCFYEELSNEQAAAVMGVRLKALQSLLMRAKTTLQKQLEEPHAGQ